jgi:hypothetical protein
MNEPKTLVIEPAPPQLIQLMDMHVELVDRLAPRLP